MDTSLFNALLYLYMEISLEVYVVGRDLKINVSWIIDNLVSMYKFTKKHSFTFCKTL